MHFVMKKIREGFTLIELILVIAIISILAVIVIFALNPSKQLAEAHNSVRWQAVNTFVKAVGQYQVDHAGQLPSGVSTTLQMLGTDGSGCAADCGNGSSGANSGSFTDDTQTEFNTGTYSDTQ